jgi:hypothetical protein
MRTKADYELYLKSDHWQALRALAVESVGYECQMCHKKTRFVHVHHFKYRRLYNVIPSDLVVLCETCHHIVHHNIERGNKPENLEQLAQLAQEVNQRLKKSEKNIAKACKIAAKKRFKTQEKLNKKFEREKRKNAGIK